MVVDGCACDIYPHWSGTRPEKVSTCQQASGPVLRQSHFPLVRMDNRGSQPLMIIRDRPVAVLLLKTRGTVNRLRGKISRAIKGHQVVALQKRHCFKRLTSLELTKDACERRPQRLG